MPPSSKTTWFWPTLTATASLGVCWAMRTSSWSARAGTLASRLPSSAAVSAVTLTESL